MLQRKGKDVLKQDNGQGKSFMELLREDMQRRRERGSGGRTSQILMRVLMIFQAPTQLYAFMTYIVPYVFSDYDPWIIYYMRILCWFIFINSLTNWICVILYDPSYSKTKDNPNINVSHLADNPPDQFRPLIEEVAANNQKGSVVYDLTTKEALPWIFCERCEIHIPPRAHHCKRCRKCILKRDHHCFMVGTCIGFKNQRYFIVLAFYILIAGGLGCFFTCKYLKEVYWPAAVDWMDLVPPVALWRWLCGTMKGHVCLMIVHLYLEGIFGFFGLAYFTSQMTIAAEGKTPFEVAKKIPIKNINSRQQNIKSVFGDFWILNFLFPMTLVFRQMDDGIRWEGLKYDHIANDKSNIVRGNNVEFHL